MVEIRKVTNREQWDDYGLAHGAHPLQLWGWGKLKSAHGWTADRLFLMDDDTVIGAAQVLTRRLPLPLKAFSYIPRGPIMSGDWNPEYLDAFANYAKREYGSVSLSIEPDSENFLVPEGWRHTDNKVLPAQTIILDLTKSEADLMAAMAKKTRQYIRKSTTEVTIRQVKTPEMLEQCLALYHQTAERAGFALHDDQYYLDVYSSLQDQSPIFMAYAGDEPVAFLWLAISARTAFELYGGMNEEGQMMRANYSLKWYAIEKCKEWGLERYDFGGLIEGGVSTFKRGWADEATVLAGTFDKPLSPFYGLWSKGLPTAKRVVRKLRPSGSRHR